MSRVKKGWQDADLLPPVVGGTRYGSCALYNADVKNVFTLSANCENDIEKCVASKIAQIHQSVKLYSKSYLAIMYFDAIKDAAITI